MAVKDITGNFLEPEENIPGFFLEFHSCYLLITNSNVEKAYVQAKVFFRLPRGRYER